MSQGDLEGRINALETTVDGIKRVLAGAADRDVTEIRAEIRDFRNATTASFNALRQDFVELREDVGDLRAHVGRGFEQVDRGFAEMRGKLDATAGGQEHIADLIQRLIDGQDR